MPTACQSCGNDDPNLIVGIEHPGVYDGVVEWSCMCGHEWRRFPQNGRINRALDAMRKDANDDAERLPEGTRCPRCLTEGTVRGFRAEGGDWTCDFCGHIWQEPLWRVP